jgi:hypothetical protein
MLDHAGLLAGLAHDVAGGVLQVQQCNAGLAAVHNGGTATAGKVQLYVTGAGDGAVLAECNASVDLSTSQALPFVAVGQAY